MWVTTRLWATEPVLIAGVITLEGADISEAARGLARLIEEARRISDATATPRRARELLRHLVTSSIEP